MQENPRISAVPELSCMDLHLIFVTAEVSCLNLPQFCKNKTIMHELTCYFHDCETIRQKHFSISAGQEQSGENCRALPKIQK